MYFFSLATKIRGVVDPSMHRGLVLLYDYTFIVLMYLSYPCWWAMGIMHLRNRMYLDVFGLTHFGKKILFFEKFPKFWKLIWKKKALKALGIDVWAL